eukprot:2078165-Rhodomonas_salina.1
MIVAGDADGGASQTKCRVSSSKVAGTSRFPKTQCDMPTKCSPRMVTRVAPDVGPLRGIMELTIGL